MFRLSWLGTIGFLFLLNSCGTYSNLRSADTLDAGHVEGNFGAGFNGLGEVVPVFQINAGLTDRFEIGGQYETYSGEGWLRWGILKTKSEGFALSVEGGGGYVHLFEMDASNNLTFKGETSYFLGASIGKSFSYLEPYLGYRYFWLPTFNSDIHSVKLGLRLKLWKTLIIGGEGGVTVHNNTLSIGEGAVTFGLNL